MEPTGFPPIVRRSLIAAALFTLAIWLLLAAALVAWAPGRDFATGLVGRLGQAVTAQASAVPLAAIVVSGLAVPCASDDAYSYGDDDNAQDFAWNLTDAEGRVWIDDGARQRREFNVRSGRPRFWFRASNDEFVVTDPGVIAEVREAARPLRDIGQQMGEVGREIGRHGARVGRFDGRVETAAARLALIEARLLQRTAARGQHAALDASLDELRAQVSELRARTGRERALHAGEQQALARRLEELAARQHETVRAVREKVRAIAERARRMGKAERPHASA